MNVGVNVNVNVNLSIWCSCGMRLNKMNGVDDDVMLI